MSDIIERLKRGEGCLEEGGQSCISMSAESGCLCAIAADNITRLTAEVDWHKENSDKWQDTQAAHLREVTRLTAENEKLRAALEEIIQDSFSVYAIRVARAALSGDNP